MAAVAVVIAPFFAAINIVTRQAVGASSPDNIILMTLVRDSGGVISVYDGSDGSLGVRASRFMLTEWVVRDLLPCFHMLMSRP